MPGPALAIGLIAAGLTATGSGLNIAGSLKPYIEKKEAIITNTPWGDQSTAGTVSGIGYGVESDLRWRTYKVENQKARKLRTAGAVFTGLGSIMSSVAGGFGGGAGAVATSGLTNANNAATNNSTTQVQQKN